MICRRLIDKLTSEKSVGLGCNNQLPVYSTMVNTTSAKTVSTQYVLLLPEWRNRRICAALAMNLKMLL